MPAQNGVNFFVGDDRIGGWCKRGAKGPSLDITSSNIMLVFLLLSLFVDVGGLVSVSVNFTVGGTSLAALFLFLVSFFDHMNPYQLVPSPLAASGVWTRCNKMFFVS